MKPVWLKILLFALGFLPFALGGFMNRAMTAYETVSLPMIGIMGFVFLFFWGAVAFLAKPHFKDGREVVVVLNAAAAIDLILVGFQELILHADWFHFVGRWSQLFYLPLLRIGFTLTSWSSSVFPAYCASFALMVIASALGCRLRKG